jgi:hypothetical protein
LENAKKNLVFHFGGGRHASFPQKPVVKLVSSFWGKPSFYDPKSADQHSSLSAASSERKYSILLLKHFGHFGHRDTNDY